MSDGSSTDGGDSPVIIQEAESTQPSPQSEQAGSPHSPDSTGIEQGAETNQPRPPSELAQSNPNLVNMLISTEPLPSVMVSIDRGAGSSAPSQVPDSPARRKREGEMPAPQPFSPTKKMKSPDKGKRK